MNQAELVSKGKECVGELKQKIEEKPLVAVAIALVIGIVIGRFPELFLVVLFIAIVGVALMLILSNDDKKDKDDKDNKNDKTNNTQTV